MIYETGRGISYGYTSYYKMVSSRPSRPAEPFDQMKHYGRTSTLPQKNADGPSMLFDHDPPLVKHYEGDGKGGMPGYKMTQQERLKYASAILRMILFRVGATE